MFQSLSGLLRATPLEQIVGPQHHDQQVGVSRKDGGGVRDLPSIFPML